MPTTTITIIVQVPMNRDGWTTLCTVPLLATMVRIQATGGGRWNIGGSPSYFGYAQGSPFPASGPNPGIAPTAVDTDWTTGAAAGPSSWSVYWTGAAIPGVTPVPLDLIVVQTATGAGGPARPYDAAAGYFRPNTDTTYAIGNGAGQIAAGSDLQAIFVDLPGAYADNDFGPITVTLTFTVPALGVPVLTGSTGCHGCRADLSWTSVSGADGYRIYRAPATGGPLLRVHDQAASAGTTWTDTGVALRQQYAYTVTALSALLGESAVSNIVTVSTCLDAPVLTGPTDCEGCQATLSWTASDGATGYRLYRVRDLGHDAPEFVPQDATQTPPEPLPGDDGSAAVLVYDGPLLTALDTGVCCVRHYLYQAYAYSACGTSPASNAVPVTPCCQDARQALPSGAAARSGELTPAPATRQTLPVGVANRGCGCC